MEIMRRETEIFERMEKTTNRFMKEMKEAIEERDLETIGELLEVAPKIAELSKRTVEMAKQKK